jgi:hypothetical protein
MSVYRATYTAAVGTLIAVLDAVLVTNPNWSIHDASAGTNAKVYKCVGDSKTWYVHVNDNNAAYAILALWQGWDEGSHVGTGATIGNVYWRKIAGAYRIVLRDTYFVWMTYGTNTTHVYYCGQPILLDSAESSPMIIGHGASGQTADPIAMMGTYSTQAYWRSLRLSAPAGETCYCFGFDTSNTKFECVKSSREVILPIRSIYYGSDNVLFGYLDGVWSSGGATGEMPLSGTQFLADGVLWMAHYSSKFVAVRMQ